MVDRDPVWLANAASDHAVIGTPVADGNIREIYHGSDTVILFDMQEECIKT